MPYDPVDLSEVEAGETPPAPGDGDVDAVTVEDKGGDPQGFLIHWKHLDDGWFYAENPDSYVSLDSNM